MLASSKSVTYSLNKLHYDVEHFADEVTVYMAEVQNGFEIVLKTTEYED